MTHCLPRDGLRYSRRKCTIFLRRCRGCGLHVAPPHQAKGVGAWQTINNNHDVLLLLLEGPRSSQQQKRCDGLVAMVGVLGGDHPPPRESRVLLLCCQEGKRDKTHTDTQTHNKTDSCQPQEERLHYTMPQFPPFVFQGTTAKSPVLLTLCGATGTVKKMLIC